MGITAGSDISHRYAYLGHELVPVNGHAIVDERGPAGEVRDLQFMGGLSPRRFFPDHAKRDHAYDDRQERARRGGQAHGKEGVREQLGGHVHAGDAHQHDGGDVMDK